MVGTDVRLALGRSDVVDVALVSGDEYRAVVVERDVAQFRGMPGTSAARGVVLRPVGDGGAGGVLDAAQSAVRWVGYDAIVSVTPLASDADDYAVSFADALAAWKSATVAMARVWESTGTPADVLGDMWDRALPDMDSLASMIAGLEIARRPVGRAERPRPTARSIASKPDPTTGRPARTMRPRTRSVPRARVGSR